MKDRVPTYPGRVRLAPVAGQEHVYDLTRADSPTEPGTAYSKATMLTDDTAAAISSLTGTEPETVNEALAYLAGKGASLTSEVGARAKIQTGTYTGAGVYASQYPNKLTFSFTPKLVIITPWGENITAEPIIWGSASFRVIVHRASGTVHGSYLNTLTCSGNQVSWYNTAGAEHQLNKLNTTYRYVALG